MTDHPMSRFRAASCLLTLAVSAAAMQYAPSAEAHGGRRFGGAGWFAGGLVVGAVFAPRYAYPAPVYYYPPPPTYYAPPPVVYTQPPVVIQSAPAVVAAPPIQAQTQAPSIEDRLRRLRSLCEQGLLTPQECQSRREEVLREL